MITEYFINNGKTYTIYIGQNKTENWLLLDTSEPNNIWFHLADAPSPYVILNTNVNLDEIPKSVLYRCGILCKLRSSSKKHNNCYVNYTYIKNVNKGKHIGEVIITNYKNIRV